MASRTNTYRRVLSDGAYGPGAWHIVDERGRTVAVKRRHLAAMLLTAELNRTPHRTVQHGRRHYVVPSAVAEPTPARSRHDGTAPVSHDGVGELSLARRGAVA